MFVSLPRRQVRQRRVKKRKMFVVITEEEGRQSSNEMNLIELINYAGNDFYAPVVLFIATMRI